MKSTWACSYSSSGIDGIGGHGYADMLSVSPIGYKEDADFQVVCRCSTTVANLLKDNNSLHLVHFGQIFSAFFFFPSLNLSSKMELN